MDDYASIRLPNLKSLRVENPNAHTNQNFWTRYLDSMIINDEHADSFWKLCTRLERLELLSPCITSYNNPSPLEFPRIKSLIISGLDQHFQAYHIFSVLLEFKKRCPSLTTFSLSSSEHRLENYFIPGFIQSLSAGTWPNFKLSGDDLSSIIGSMKQIHILNVPRSWNMISPHHMELLRSHLSNITELNLGKLGTTNSAIGQEILCSCPLLKRLIVSFIDATDVAEIEPWVCVRLQQLDAGFRLDPLTILHVQPLVFLQLSRLTRIEELVYMEFLTFSVHLWLFKNHSISDLSTGLHKLATLRRLTTFNFCETMQRMRIEEVEWMLQHWKHLDEFLGVLNRWDRHVDMMLIKRLQEHEVRYFKDLRFSDQDGKEVIEEMDKE
ncbi:hypothetical protein BGZ65_007140 [Modicella reniformis]|uniref:Uncharacterized protein n=1 Tax=Modicella reniformis TaxID=1440133 RepID=A0A9P6JH68_9FUNG|nr:hypothetical protein BGZ65_007140 [Modicella reniformis]